MEKLDTLHFIEMTKEQKELSCSIINRFGTGQHPVADESTYDGFAVDYLRELLLKPEFLASEKNLSDVGKKTLEEIRAKL